MPHNLRAGTFARRHGAAVIILLSFAGHTYDISNKHRLGYSEVELVQKMIDGVNELYRTDLELQKKHGL